MNRRRGRQRNVREGREATISGNVLFSITEHILLSIVNRVGRIGFQELGPLLATGVLGRDLVYNEEVLKEAGLLQNFLNDATLVHTWSIYRPFFMRCVNAGNVVARYLESLRLAVYEGKAGEAIALLLNTPQLSEEMEFALAMFLVGNDQYHLVDERLDYFKARVGSLERADYVSDAVFAHMRQIVTVAPAVDHPFIDIYINSQERKRSLPPCYFGTPCNIINRCEHCWNYYRIMMFHALY